MTMTLKLRDAAPAVKNTSPDPDPIALEILRNRLNAIGDDAALTIERTAVSPVVSEGKDYGIGILGPDGDLIGGGGYGAEMHWPTMHYAVRSTIARYGDDIHAGDVFLANDTHNGGGLHPSDVLVQRPVFFGERRIGWAVATAHVMDVGGLSPGGFMPGATECYQEGLHLPPVRLSRRGEEITDVWDIIRNNVRMSAMVEMDIRSLVAGANVVQAQLASLAETMGVDDFVQGLEMICDLSEREMRRRILALADGLYRSTAWIENAEDFYRIPCALTVDGDEMTFDFDGAPPQVNRFLNSRKHVVKTMLMALVRCDLAIDLPYTQGLLAPVEVLCPAGSILDARPPAPINSAHVFVGASTTAGLDCLRMAIQASPGHPAAGALHSTTLSGGGSAWSCVRPDGHRDTWLIGGVIQYGAGAAKGRDGEHRILGARFPAADSGPAAIDVEVLEEWYPILYGQNAVRVDGGGAGSWRGGQGALFTITPHGTDHLVGQIFGTRRWLPFAGIGGGDPGDPQKYLIRRADGSVEELSLQAANVVLKRGEWLEVVQGAMGGGFGDPLDRALDAIGTDIRRGVLSLERAKSVYGAVFDSAGAANSEATDVERARLRAERLADAVKPEKSLSPSDIAGLWESGEPAPLQWGVEQRGAVAFAMASGTPLAIAPAHWTDGCAVLEKSYRPGVEPDVITRAYLDPATGRALHVEVALRGEPRTFEARPLRWSRSAPSPTTKIE